MQNKLNYFVLSVLACQLIAPRLIVAQDTATKSPTARAESKLVASDYVHIESGNLPIILSAPHGGNMSPPDVPPRSGEGLEPGASGFFTGRDTGTEELAREVADAIEKRFGKRPYLVASKVNRKFLDPNRPAKIAFDSPAIEPIYDLYHQSLAKFCREVTNRFHVGVLLDIHGQGSRSDTVFRGTKDGLTVTRLRETFGQAAHDGTDSLFGELQSRGWTVFPKLTGDLTQPVDKEQSGYTGGHIVQTYGSHKSQPIDAMQLEFGMDYRTVANRPKTAVVLADALADYATTYLSLEVPPRSPDFLTVPTEPSMQPDPSKIQVALFVDRGVSSTAALMEVLAQDKSLAVTKVSAADIQEGQLKKYAALIHPGGSGSGQGKALGESGRAQVKQFIESGHGMVGICAGAYLASCDYEWSLHVLDAKVIDRAHWNRGTGTVAVSLLPRGKELLQLDQQKIDLYYGQGPLLAPANDPNVPDFEELARYEGEIAKNGAPTGVMPGTTAIALGTYGKGRVVCYSPHPEKTPGYTALVLRGLHWAIGEPAPSDVPKR